MPAKTIHHTLVSDFASPAHIQRSTWVSIKHIISRNSAHTKKIHLYIHKETYAIFLFIKQKNTMFMQSLNCFMKTISLKYSRSGVSRLLPGRPCKVRCYNWADSCTARCIITRIWHKLLAIKYSHRTNNRLCWFLQDYYIHKFITRPAIFLIVA
jgi:hypothetical protein